MLHLATDDRNPRVLYEALRLHPPVPMDPKYAAHARNRPIKRFADHFSDIEYACIEYTQLCVWKSHGFFIYYYYYCF